MRELRIVAHQVIATDTDGDTICFESYDLDRWQFAMKNAKFLRDKGYEDVKVIDCFEEVEGDEA